MTLPLPLVDPDDPKYKHKGWDEIEAQLAINEAIQVSSMGYDLEEPEETGPSPAFPCRPLLSQFPWEEKIDGFAKPASCTLQNWKHTCLQYTVGKGCATLVFSKGAANNTIDPAMLDALQDAILDLQTQKDVRVVVMKAEGKLFSNGFDPKYIMSESTKSEEDIKAVQMQFAKVLHFLSTLPQFVLALVQGSAMGAGIGLLCACDMVYSIKGAYFAMNEGKLGVVPSVSLPYIMRRISYMAHTRQLVLAAASLSALQAKECGLVQEVYEDDASLQAACKDFLTKMSACAPGAVAVTKQIILNTQGQAPSSFLMNYVSSLAAAQRSSSEAKLGIEAIQSKKRPAWAESVIEA